MRKKKNYLSLLGLITSACATIPNTRVCTVAGSISAGMNCAYTLSKKTEEMTVDETFYFLEPRDSPARSGAICMSAFDYAKFKNALEQSCHLLGSRCQKEAVLP